MAEKNNRGSGMGAVAGLGAALAAAAGAYWLYGSKDAAKNRRMAKSWMLKARAEVMDKVEKLQNMDRSEYMALVDSVVAAASGAAAATRPEVARVTRDLKQAWSYMQAQMKQPVTKTRARKRAKKASKKSSK